jgi:hypothetical protein
VSILPFPGAAQATDATRAVRLLRLAAQHQARAAADTGSVPAQLRADMLAAISDGDMSGLIRAAQTMRAHDRARSA